MPDPTRSQWLQTLEIISNRQPDQDEAAESPASRVIADIAVISPGKKYFSENMSRKSENDAYIDIRGVISSGDRAICDRVIGRGA